MPVRTVTHNLFKLFGLKFERTVSSFRNKLAVYNIRKNEYDIIGDKIFFKELDVRVPVSNAASILERYKIAIQLSKKGGFTFFINADGQLCAKNNDLQFQINDEEELFILSEVFLEGAYNLISPTQKKIALIDIGMNVGITTLFYAAKNNVEKVFSFEPFAPTFSMALKNIELNKLYAHKINASNFGLATEDADIVVSYSPKQKGRMGIKGLPQTKGYIPENICDQLIHLKSVREEFLKIKENVTEHFVVCKIDAEGAEYEIIDALAHAGLLTLADVYFIEWHQVKPSAIVSKLKASNYNVIETAFSLLHSGMIYAIRKDT
jgi:FkbM family methyltransferase